MYDVREFTAAGRLISYGVSLTDTYRLIAGQVARILKGAKPADLPILQPTKFELVVNLRTAKTLGLTIPEAFLLRADEVIESNSRSSLVAVHESGLARNGYADCIARMSALWVPAQPVDATQALNLSAGVSNCKVSRGRSFS
jgi:hypothetical protein